MPDGSGDVRLTPSLDLASWWLVPEGELRWAKKKDPTSERRVLVAGEARSGLVPLVARTGFEDRGRPHARHEPEHETTCRIDCRGAIVMTIFFRAEYLLTRHGTYSCREQDDTLVEDVMLARARVVRE